jgi:hypothetical protein
MSYVARWARGWRKERGDNMPSLLLLVPAQGSAGKRGGVVHTMCVFTEGVNDGHAIRMRMAFETRRTRPFPQPRPPHAHQHPQTTPYQPPTGSCSVMRATAPCRCPGCG